MYYSTVNSPKPNYTYLVILTLDLYYKDCKKLHESLLRGKGGIYYSVNIVNGKQYIGSVK